MIRLELNLLKQRECFSKWAYDYGKTQPKFVEMSKKLKSKLPTDTIYYQLPEVDKRFEELRKDEKKFDQLWTGFRRHVESESTFESTPVMERFDEIKENANNLKKKSSKMGPQSMDKESKAKLERKRQFIQAIEELRMNAFFDPENFNESDLNEENNEVLAKMKKDKLFWRNFGRCYNRAFERNLNYKDKVEVIEQNMAAERQRIEEEYPNLVLLTHVSIGSSLFNKSDFLIIFLNNKYVTISK